MTPAQKLRAARRLIAAMDRKTWRYINVAPTRTWDVLSIGRKRDVLRLLDRAIKIAEEGERKT